nr:MAG TPA: hypothetical protein [Caudoviricetes sp.]
MRGFVFGINKCQSSVVKPTFDKQKLWGTKDKQRLLMSFFKKSQ